MTYLQDLRQSFIHMAMYGISYMTFYNLSQWWNGLPFWFPSYPLEQVVACCATIIILSPLMFIFKERARYEANLGRDVSVFEISDDENDKDRST